MNHPQTQPYNAHGFPRTNPRWTRRAKHRGAVLEALSRTINDGRWPEPNTVAMIREWCNTASANELRDLLADLLPGATR